MENVRSMTGFGRSEIVEGTKKLLVEIKAVNHRYLDLNIKMPKKFNCFESNIRNLLKMYMERGKVDIYIYYEDKSLADVSVGYHPEIAREYMAAFREMSKEFGIDCNVGVGVLAGLPEVFSLEGENVDEEELWKLLENGIGEAVSSFNEARNSEGEKLKKDLLLKLDSVSETVDFIKSKEPEIIEKYKSGLVSKVQEMLGQSVMDENRILTEVALFADRVCIDEEIVRLKSHVDGMIKELKNGGAIGRKLDFLAQEMNREANTILSKSNDVDITEKGILLKTDIEKIREQIQNIE